MAEKYSFYVKCVPLGDVFKYGVGFRSLFFVDWEYDNIADLPFMFDPWREIVIFPDTVPVKVQKQAVRVLLRVVNRKGNNSKSQQDDYDKLDVLFGDCRTYNPVGYMFMHYFQKRSGFIDECFHPSLDTVVGRFPTYLFACSEKRVWKEVFPKRDYKQLQTAEDFLKGNDKYYQITA